MTIANVEMAAAWDGDEGDHWTEHADRYEKAADRHWHALLRTVEIAGADSVLDVGCGTGKSSRDAGRIAASGSVLGVDLSSRMLEYARAAAEREGLTNVQFEQADAQVHPFPPDVFDVAVSSFGAMFFADPVAAFANIEQALRPRGHLALLTWRELERNEWLAEIRAALAVGRHLPTPPPGAPGPFGLADADHVEHVLTKAGFTGVRFDAVNEPINLGTNTDDAFSFAQTLGITKGLTGDLDEASRTEALNALQRTLADHETDDGVVLGSSAWLITARSGANSI